MKPTFAHGEICYLEIPALDTQQSADFYQNVFGWRTRNDNNGNISFDDAAGEVSGMWVKGRSPQADSGIRISIMTFDMADSIKLIIENGGAILQQPDFEAREVLALFSDPGGNVFSLYQHSAR